MNGFLRVGGFKTAGIAAGIKKDATKKDLMLIYSETPAVCAGVFTLNLASAAPVVLSKSRMSSENHQAIIVNSGNANACTGEEGYRNAVRITKLAADALQIAPDAVLNASTGIIGVQLPMAPFEDNIEKLVGSLGESSSPNAPEAILTTDTFPKAVSKQIDLNGTTVTLSGFAKGSGMIHPNMATMLGFIMTDAAIEKDLLQTALSKATTVSFNQVSVDGDTSTNDCTFVMANGTAGNKKIVEADGNFELFYSALAELCIELAKLIARDGEGATKMLEVCVSGASDDIAARKLAKSVIGSSLVKAAFFGNDANWGRIVCALGYAGVAINLEKTVVTLKSAGGSVKVFENGAGIVFDEELALKVLKEGTVVTDITLQDGNGIGTAWGCDLTYDYVKINGDYRS